MKIYRKYDLIDKTSEMELLYVFKKFPVFMGCTNKNSKKDILSDMKWWIGKKTGFIQLNPYVNLNIVYQSSHGSGKIGNIWKTHHINFSKFIELFKPQNVLEIGGGHGILAKNYLKHNNISWSIVEPNPDRKFKKIRYIKNFFDKQFVNSNIKKYDTVIHSHLFEHVTNPMNFLTLINKILDNNGKLIFSIPNLNKMLKNKNLSTFNFEHTIFLSMDYIDTLLKKNNFYIVKKTFFQNDHSIFYSTIKTNKKQKLNFNGKKYYEKNKKNFLNFIYYYKNLVERYNNKLLKNDKPFFIFGAHIFTQYLLNFGLNTEKIIFILDNDKDKHNKRLYGTKLYVNSPKILSKYKNPIVILRAGFYSKEIKLDILKNINKKVVFI